MCGLCGLLGGRGHWTDSTTNPEVFAGREQRHTHRRERQQRARLLAPVLAHYGLNLGDWAATSYVLRSNTGRTELVNNLTELWAAAEQLSGKQIDPLDPQLLQRLAAEPSPQTTLPDGEGNQDFPLPGEWEQG